MTQTTERRESVRASRSLVERVSDLLTAHLPPRAVGMIGGLLLALGLGYAWATLLFLQAHRGQMVVSYGLPAVMLSSAGALGVLVFLRGRDRAPGGPSRWHAALARARPGSSVRPGRPADDHGLVEQHTDAPDHRVVVRERAECRPQPTPAPCTTLRRTPPPPPAEAPEPTAPIRRAATAPPAPATPAAPERPELPGPPQVAAEPLPRPSGRHAWIDPAPETTPLRAAAPPPAPLAVVREDHEPAATGDTAGRHDVELVEPVTSARPAKPVRVRPTKKSAARPRRVAGRPTAS